jgi:hypothetical protein
MDDVGELTIQTLIKLKYAGSATEMTTYMNLVMQTGAVLIGGIVMWRVSSRFHRKKQEKRERNAFFNTTYSKGWKKR